MPPAPTPRWPILLVGILATAAGAATALAGAFVTMLSTCGGLFGVYDYRDGSLAETLCTGTATQVYFWLIVVSGPLCLAIGTAHATVSRRWLLLGIWSLVAIAASGGLALFLSAANYIG